jgi:hypothetical protein
MKTAFGWIKIGNETYDHDVIIHTDGSITRRSKKPSRHLKDTHGHTPLSSDELGFLVDEHPEVVFVGRGQYGDLPLTPDAKELLSAYHPIIRSTPDLIRSIETEKRRFVAILHVTC